MLVAEDLERVEGEELTLRALVQEAQQDLLVGGEHAPLLLLGLLVGEQARVRVWCEGGFTGHVPQEAVDKGSGLVVTTTLTPLYLMYLDNSTTVHCRKTSFT